MKSIKEKLNKKISLYYTIIAVIITVIIFSAYNGGSARHSYEDGYTAGMAAAADQVDIDSPSYAKGYEVGKSKGVQEGKEQGYTEGLAQGQAQAAAANSEEPAPTEETQATASGQGSNGDSTSTYTEDDSTNEAEVSSQPESTSAGYCITKSGDKYHYTSCSTVRKGVNEGSVTYFSEVSQIPGKYGACQRCAPPSR